jgi:hypothetical protein
MKTYRNAIILVVILGLLIGAYAFVSNKKASQGADDKRDIIRIFDLYTDNMVELTLQNEDGTFVFERNIVKEEDREIKIWKLVSHDDFKVDKDVINSIAINFSSLIADKVIEEEAEDLTKYGLDKPVTVTVKMDDGSVKAIEVGNKTPTGSGYYVKEKDSRKVYTISSYSGDKIKVSKNDIKDRQLFDVEREDVKAFTLERKNEKVFSSTKTGDYTWIMTYPIKGNTYYEAVDTMLGAVVQTRIIDFEEENASDISKYGLDKPRYAFEFGTSTNETKRFLLGNDKVKGKEVYAKLEDSDEVFTVSIEPFGFLDKPLKEIVEVFAYIVNINDVNKIVVEMDGQTTTSILETDKEDRDKDKFYVNGKDASMKDDRGSQLFRKYYQALIGVRLSEVDPEGVPEGEADITFTYYLKKDPGTMKVEFIPKDEHYYYVVKNGEYSGILVSKKEFDEEEGVRNSYKKLMEAINKQ